MKRSPARKPKPRNPAAAVDLAAVERELAGLPDRAPAPRTNTKRHLIERLREPLLDAMANRHRSPETLAELLGRRGIAIRPDTLRRYLGPITERRRRAGTVAAEPSPARAGRTAVPAAVPSARPRPGEAGSPEALARLEAVLAGASSGPPPAQPAARPEPDDPPHCPPGTFIPRPERPIDWYKPSS